MIFVHRFSQITQIFHLQQASFSLLSFIDRQELQPYFNTHCFAIDPARGILRDWQALFAHLAANQDFQAGACPDTLHQAVLSALVAGCLPRQKIRLLPSEYSYPLHMHPQVPALDQPVTLDELVCPVYEGAFVYPDTLNGLAASARLAGAARSRSSARRLIRRPRTCRPAESAPGYMA